MVAFLKGQLNSLDKSLNHGVSHAESSCREFVTNRPICLIGRVSGEEVGSRRQEPVGRPVGSV